MQGCKKCLKSSFVFFLFNHIAVCLSEYCPKDIATEYRFNLLQLCWGHNINVGSKNLVENFLQSRIQQSHPVVEITNKPK